MIKAWSVAAIATIAVSSPAFAQTRAEIEAAYSPRFDRCMGSGDAAQGITSAILSCNGAENKLQDARLNQAYKKVMARLPPPKQAALRQSERNWIEQREAQCREAAGDEGGGSSYAIIYSSCMLDETVKRTIWLNDYPPKR
jgi:uncharacterized protein YecT (DUF1311 family)